MFLLISAICLMAVVASAQTNYIRFGVGGGLGLNQYNGSSWSDEQQINNTLDNLTIKSQGLGGGFNINLAFGHMMSKYIGIEVGVNEFIGLNKKTHNTRTTTTGNTSSTATQDEKMSGMMLQLVPTIIITPGLEKINPYARLGMILGILPSQTYGFDATDNTGSGVYKEKNYGGIAAGFTAAGGVDYHLSGKMVLYAEMVFNGITYAPTKGKVTEATADGVDQLPTYTTRDKEWTYEKTYDTKANIPIGSADKRNKVSYNFSNVELNIGIKLNL